LWLFFFFLANTKLQNYFVIANFFANFFAKFFANFFGFFCYCNKQLYDMKSKTHLSDAETRIYEKLTTKPIKVAPIEQKLGLYNGCLYKFLRGRKRLKNAEKILQELESMGL
jgi:hypothetical protein